MNTSYTNDDEYPNIAFIIGFLTKNSLTPCPVISEIVRAKTRKNTGMVQKGGKKGNNLKELGKRLPPSHRGHFFNLKISSNIKKKLSRFFKRDKT
jgi:hypothetical protein